MIVSTAIQKMIGFYKGNHHDINHFLKVWAMAKTIGELEGLDGHMQEVPGEIRQCRREVSGAGKPAAGGGVFCGAAR